MNKIYKLVLLASLLIALAACGGEEATPTLAPTAEPIAEVEEPAEAPAEEPATEPAASEELALFGREVIPCPSQYHWEQNFAAEVEGETYECGVVKVPENYAEPDGRNIELAYARLFSKSENPDPVPVLYLSGGPGGSALGELTTSPFLKPNLEVIRGDRDVVVYDQRGTGLSSPLNCGPVHAAIGAGIELLPEISGALAGVESNPLQAYYFNLALCGQLLQKESSIDISQYNSISSAHDMASLITALGYDQYTPYGTSYGTKLAQVAMRETPERLANAILDGTTPIGQSQEANSYGEGTEQYVHIFEQCAANPACNEAYPNLAERFTELLNRLETEPLQIEEPIDPNPYILSVLLHEAGGTCFHGLDSIDPCFFSILFKVNNLIANHFRGEPMSILSRTPRIILAVEEGDTAYLNEVFGGGDTAGGAQEGEVAEIPIPDEQTIQPWNEYIAPTLNAILAEAQSAAMVTDESALSQQWVALVINDMVGRLENGADQEEVIRDMIKLSALPTSGNDKSVLQAYAAENLSGEVVAELNGLVDNMTAHDVRQTLWHISDVATAMSYGGSDSLGLRHLTKFVVNCAEDVAFRQDPELAFELVAQAPYPQVALDPANYAGTITLCSFFPEDVIDPSFIEPVESDIPVLLIAGQVDMQTPPSQALEVASHLPNSTIVPFNSEGHVVISKDAPCVGIVAAQFLNDPMGDLDISCSEDYIVDWVLP